METYVFLVNHTFSLDFVLVFFPWREGKAETKQTFSTQELIGLLMGGGVFSFGY